MSNQAAARYQRSMPGMIGAMLVTLLVIGAFVLFRALTREELDVPPVAVDYQATVRYAQDSGDQVVYPAGLPSGWIPTSVQYVPGEDPVFALGILTEEQEFVGLRQEDASVTDLVARYVDADAVEGDPVQLQSSVAVEWLTFTDDSGDYALVADFGDDVVIVYGSATEQEIRDFAVALTTEPIS